MKIIEPSVDVLNPPDYQRMLSHIELAARTCYKSEDKISDGSAEELIKRLITSKHDSVMEHISLSVRFICDRGVSHELVRHRLCSFSQESTRYCNYSGDKFGRELTFIRPVFWSDPHTTWELLADWKRTMEYLEDKYLSMLANGASPQEARLVLPNSLKTDIVVTANIRQWRIMFEQRCASDAHPQMRQVMIPLLGKFIADYKVFFDNMFDIHIDGLTSFANKGWQLAEVK